MPSPLTARWLAEVGFTSAIAARSIQLFRTSMEACGEANQAWLGSGIGFLSLPTPPKAGSDAL
jgi:hypothetical protein